MDHAGSASVFRSPKASYLQFRGSKQRTARLLPALAIRGTSRQGKHMYPLSATSPSARRQMLCSRALPAISNTSRPVERLLAPVPVPSLSSPIDPPVLHASPLSGKGAPRFNSFLSERAIASRKLQPKYTSSSRPVNDDNAAGAPSSRRHGAALQPLVGLPRRPGGGAEGRRRAAGPARRRGGNAGRRAGAVGERVEEARGGAAEAQLRRVVEARVPAREHRRRVPRPRGRVRAGLRGADRDGDELRGRARRAPARARAGRGQRLAPRLDRGRRPGGGGRRAAPRAGARRGGPQAVRGDRGPAAAARRHDRLARAPGGEPGGARLRPARPRRGAAEGVARRAARRGAQVPAARRRGEMISASSWKMVVCIR
ncbi:hypothetical protein PVAP13_4NG291038 [Panicum virgatum]|uniref:Uncharacterized protein n=1 Tax=Panicum virgatum TaxID=38727 RepID=A0A8T0TFY9_PANVG|nr:hypothetical protein PVAP13_4NG291038 [Panicum virgatum]